MKPTVYTIKDDRSNKWCAFVDVAKTRLSTSLQDTESEALLQLSAILAGMFEDCYNKHNKD